MTSGTGSAFRPRKPSMWISRRMVARFSGLSRRELSPVVNRWNHCSVARSCDSGFAAEPRPIQFAGRVRLSSDRIRRFPYATPRSPDCGPQVSIFRQDLWMPVLRSAFIALSRNRSMRRFCERSSIGNKLSSQFVAGLEIADSLRVAEAVNKQGIHVTLDSLGESVSSAPEAQKAADIYHQLLDSIAERRLDANISVKLTQMGLSLDPELAESIATNLAEHAQATGNFVRI